MYTIIRVLYSSTTVIYCILKVKGILVNSNEILSFKWLENLKWTKHLIVASEMNWNKFKALNYNDKNKWIWNKHVKNKMTNAYDKMAWN